MMPFAGHSMQPQRYLFFKNKKIFSIKKSCVLKKRHRIKRECVRSSSGRDLYINFAISRMRILPLLK